MRPLGVQTAAAGLIGAAAVALVLLPGRLLAPEPHAGAVGLPQTTPAHAVVLKPLPPRIRSARAHHVTPRVTVSPPASVAQLASVVTPAPVTHVVRHTVIRKTAPARQASPHQALSRKLRRVPAETVAPKPPVAPASAAPTTPAVTAAALVTTRSPSSNPAPATPTPTPVTSPPPPSDSGSGNGTGNGHGHGHGGGNGQGSGHGKGHNK